MALRTVPTRIFLLAALGVCTLVGGGCASCSSKLGRACTSCCPRIDPTGERVLLWPQNQTPPASPVAANAYGSPPPGNIPVQPALTDPVFPPSAPVAAPAAAAAVGAASGAFATMPATPHDRLTLTPERLLAPVGSEVLLRGGICTAKGYFLKDQRIDWSLAGQDVGHFVALSGRGWMKPALMPWNQPKIHGTHYATGYTTAVKAKLTRGTANPADDVQIRKGEAWVSITSSVEGTSHVTAFTPAIDSWQHRQAGATIYWVDVQWVFPPADVAGGSGPQVLSTSVTRQTDGQPLEGWLVRYEVASGGGARVGSQSGDVVEMATGSDGRASVEVTPTHSAASSQIKMQLIRPGGWHGSDTPRLVIGSGSTTIRWSGTDYLSSPASPPPASPIPPAGTTMPTGPPPTTPIGPTTPPSSTPPPAPPPAAPAAAARKPQLQLEIRGDPTAQVGKQVRFQVQIRNSGNAPATGIVMNDRFDPGLSHLGDRDRALEIENKGVGQLAPGESRALFLTFDVLKAGQLCHDVTVTSLEGARDQRRACITATVPPPQLQPGLEVVKDGDRLKNVGETALFTVVIKNTGQVPLVNVQVVDQYNGALQPRPPGPSYQTLDGRVLWQYQRLKVGETQKVEIECLCLQPNKNACSLVKVTAEAEGSAIALVDVDNHCVEIAAGAQGASPGVAAAAPQENLQMEILSYGNSARVGTRTTFQIIVKNGAAVPDEQVALRVLFPPELTPDVTAVQANVQVRAVGNELQFEPLATLRPGERLPFTIPVTVNRAGQARIDARLVSRNVPQGIQKTETVEIVGR